MMIMLSWYARGSLLDMSMTSALRWYNARALWMVFQTKLFLKEIT